MYIHVYRIGRRYLKKNGRSQAILESGHKSHFGQNIIPVYWI